MELAEKKLFKGAAILGFGTFTAKVIGATFRVPLTAVIGASGLGLYQTVFPVYTVLLEFSGAGAPNAISKIVSSFNGFEREEKARTYLYASIKLFSTLGIISTLFMMLFSGIISSLQGNPDASYSYLALAPAVFFVCFITCYRGFFQGLSDMTPTAVSQVIEQVIKLFFGLFLAKLFMPDLKKAVAGVVFSITISEIFAFLFLRYKYKKREKAFPVTIDKRNISYKPLYKEIIKYAFPITLIGITLPLSQLTDSFIIVNGLSYTENPTALFGLLTGVAVTVVGLPVSVCYGIAVSAIPSVSGAKTEDERTKNTGNALLITLLFALPASFLIYLFSPLIVKILFRSLSVSDKNLSVNLIRLISSTVLLQSVLQTTNSIMIGRNKPYIPVISMTVGIIVKTVTEILLVKNPDFNIYGGGVALIACYFTADLINLLSVISLRNKNADKTDKVKGQVNR